MVAKQLVGSLVATFFFATSASAMWIRALLADLVRESDAAVVAVLTDVDQYTEDGIDYANGTLAVERIVFGKRLPGSVTLRWRNPSNLACPRVEHKHLAGKRALWLLTLEESGDVRADHPSRVVPFASRRLEVALTELAEYGTSSDERVETLRKLLRDEAAERE
jgi:hypothetical protein